MPACCWAVPGDSRWPSQALHLAARGLATAAPSRPVRCACRPSLSVRASQPSPPRSMPWASCCRWRCSASPRSRCTGWHADTASAWTPSP
uniref:Alternative protein GPR78 n=1 Tax=Homo sapiens TaxID=9606 RepID=L8E9J7_HUMAN|nr:alternative protein GPR78 [Homo sapiens]